MFIAMSVSRTYQPKHRSGMSDLVTAARLLFVRAHTNRSTGLECPTRTASLCSHTYQPEHRSGMSDLVTAARLLFVRVHTNRSTGLECPTSTASLCSRTYQPEHRSGMSDPHGFSLFAHIPTEAPVWNGRPSDPFMLGSCTFWTWKIPLT